MKNLNPRLAVLTSFAVTLVLFLPYLGRMHLFDDAEHYFANLVFNMHEQGGFFTILREDENYWRFPPVFMWIQSVFTRIFGFSAFSLRFSGPVAGFITLIVLFRIGRRVQDEKLGFIWMLSYACCILPLMYFKSGLPYPWTNLFMLLAVTHFAYYFIFQEFRFKNLFLSAFFLSTAVLITGPVLVIIIGLTFFSWLIMNRFRITLNLRDIAIYILTFIIFGGSWFFFHVITGNPEGVRELFTFQFSNIINPVHKGEAFFIYPLLLMFLGLFPVSVFALPALKGSIIESYRGKSYALWMRVFFWVSLSFGLISNRMANNYSTISFIPLSFLGAQMIYRIFQEKERFREYFRLLLFLISTGFIIIYILICLGGYGFFDMEKISLFITPEIIALTVQNELWTGYELVPLGILIMFLLAAIYFIRDRRTGLIIIFASVAIFVTVLLIQYSNKYEKLQITSKGILPESITEKAKRTKVFIYGKNEMINSQFNMYKYTSLNNDNPNYILPTSSFDR